MTNKLNTFMADNFEVSKMQHLKQGEMPMDEKPPCEICGGGGWLSNWERGEQVVTKCECRKAEDFQKNLQKSGIQESFRKRNFDNFITKNERQAEVKQRAKNWLLHGESKGILFCGQIGSGKTHLGVAVLNAWLSSGYSVRFDNYTELMRKLSSRAMDESFDRMMKEIKDTDFYMLDDLFKANIRETHINYIYEIINNRYERNQRTILTSEKSLGQILEIDEGIGSRIAEMCRGNIIHMEGVGNYRLRK